MFDQVRDRKFVGKVTRQIEALRRSQGSSAAGDAGASLILALVYIIAISLVVVALAGWVSNDLSATTKFSNAAQYDSALKSVTELGIQNIRYYPLDGKAIPGPSYCWQPAAGGTISSQNINGYSVAVWCSTVSVPTSYKTRTVTLDACLSSVSEASCVATPALKAVVVFDDYLIGQLTSQVTCTATCGESATTQYWSFGTGGGSTPLPSTTTTLSGTTTTTTIPATTSSTTSTTSTTTTSTTTTSTTTTSTTSTTTSTTTTTVAGTPKGTDIQGSPNVQNGLPDNGDRISFTYNQVMKASSLATTFTGASLPVFAQFTRVSGQSTVLTICVTSNCSTQVNLGTVSLGDQTGNRYISSSSTAYLNATMTMSTVSGQSVVLVTLGTVASGTLTAENPTSTKTTLLWTPSSGATNTVGTATSTTAVTQSNSPVLNF